MRTQFLMTPVFVYFRRKTRSSKFARERDLCGSGNESGFFASPSIALTRLRRESGNVSIATYRRPSLVGESRVDIIFGLVDINARHILKKIFNELDDADLVAFSAVSAAWHGILSRDADASRRKDLFLDERRRIKENIIEPAQIRIPFFGSPRKAMADKSNCLPNSKRKNPEEETLVTSPGKVRHNLFRSEAEKLTASEQLRTCPRCTAPSKVRESEAVCTRRSCQFTFCTRCLCEKHADVKDCKIKSLSVKAIRSSRTPKAKAASASSVIGSKKSRNRLRRL